jgi:hypothetical protein
MASARRKLTNRPEDSVGVAYYSTLDRTVDYSIVYNKGNPRPADCLIAEEDEVTGMKIHHTRTIQ